MCVSLLPVNCVVAYRHFFNPGMDLGFPETKNPGQRFDRETIASNVRAYDDQIQLANN